MLFLRAVFALAVVTVAVLFLRQGVPLGALAVVVAGILVRRSAESGRLRRLASRSAGPS